MQTHYEKQIAAAAQDVWDVLGENFGDLSWTTAVRAVSLKGQVGVGAVRTCEFPPNLLSRTGTFQERLISFDRERMRFAYEGEDRSGIIERATNAWSIVDLGAQRSLVSSHVTIALKGAATLLTPLVWFAARTMVAKVLGELAQHVERGARSGATSTTAVRLTG